MIVFSVRSVSRAAKRNVPDGSCNCLSNEIFLVSRRTNRNPIDRDRRSPNRIVRSRENTNENNPFFTSSPILFFPPLSFAHDNYAERTKLGTTRAKNNEFQLFVAPVNESKQHRTVTQPEAKKQIYERILKIHFNDQPAGRNRTKLFLRE